MESVNILYMHGMGGGGDSRIPSILREHINSLSGMKEERIFNVVVRTYDFNPEIAVRQIASWMEELSPVLVAGESLGALNALRIKGVPHILISPSLNAPLYLGYLSFLSLVPGVTWLLDKIYKPKEGDRQKLHFTFRTLKNYIRHRSSALANSPALCKDGKPDSFFAFFGERDHYRKSGIVSVRTWKKYFGPDSFAMYPGTHFMEEEFVISMLVPQIISYAVRE